MSKYILSIDQGTSSTRAILFDLKGKIVSQAQQEFQQYYPENGWVEHDPEEIWQSTLNVCHAAIDKKNASVNDIASIGITNQRETTVLWNKSTGEVIHNAIVWQDRRTSSMCDELKKSFDEKILQEKTGLLFDPYFSATKIQWILTHVSEARRLAQSKQLAFGTIDSFLIWRFSGGKSHVTDLTNASRTLLFNIQMQQWDKELLQLFQIPEQILPTVLDCDAEFAITDKKIFGRSIPITGVAGDQQAALIGQACFKPGMIKSTYGTGGFLLMNTGEEIVSSQNRLLSTIAYRIKGLTHYGLEGSIFNAGTAIKWLRDNLQIIQHTDEIEPLVNSISDMQNIYFVPAFTGLGAPYWRSDVRGSIQGLDRNCSKAHIVRAALEAACYQTRDLLDCMIKDGAHSIDVMRVDGGMACNHFLLQFLAGILNIRIERPKIIETTALGAALLAGLGAGIYSSLEEVSNLWTHEQSFEPMMTPSHREKCYEGWIEAVNRITAP